MENKCQTIYSDCPLMSYGRAPEMLKGRIKGTPLLEEEAVRKYDETNLIKCLDECHVTGAPPNPVHHQTWQMIWVQNHGIYNGIDDERDMFQHFFNASVEKDGKRLPLTWVDMFELWYALRYFTDDKMEEIGDTPILYNWAIERLSRANKLAKKLNPNYSPVEAATFLRL